MRCSSEISGPICDSGSNPEPSLSDFAILLTPSTTCSNTGLSTNNREPATQTCPALEKIASAAPGIACSKFASANTITGDLPPSSRDTFFKFPEACIMIFRAVAEEPVKAILSTPGCSASAAPVLPSPVTMLTTPGGNPACSKSSPNNSVLMGVCSAGLKTQVQPAAKAGASFHAAITKGPFHGTICATTPIGSRWVYA